MSEHTKGKWVVRPSVTYRAQIEVVQPRGKPDVIARITTPKGGADVAEANANLISAAPDMLEALVRLTRSVLHMDQHPAMEAARAAIKKARGEK